MKKLDKKVLNIKDKYYCYHFFKDKDTWYQLIGVLNLRRNFIDNLRLLAIKEWWSPWNAKRWQTVYRKYRLRLKNEKTRNKRKAKKV